MVCSSHGRDGVLLSPGAGQEFFDFKLKQLCLSWLVDNVYSIREACAAPRRTACAAQRGLDWAAPCPEAWTLVDTDRS